MSFVFNSFEQLLLKRNLQTYTSETHNLFKVVTISSNICIEWSNLNSSLRFEANSKPHKDKVRSQSNIYGHMSKLRDLH